MKAMTVSTKPDSVKQDWYVVDASGKTLGRLCSELARRLRGKHKPEFTPHMDAGDYLIVVNAEKIAVTGKKLTDKMYYRFTGYIGNMKSETLGQALNAHPARVIETAVKGVLGQGLRTADIFSAGTTRVGTREMGDAVVAQLARQG